MFELRIEYTNIEYHLAYSEKILIGEVTNDRIFYFRKWCNDDGILVGDLIK